MRKVLAIAAVVLPLLVSGQQSSSASVTMQESTTTSSTDPLASQIAAAATDEAALAATKQTLAADIAAGQQQQVQLGQLIISNQQQIQLTLSNIAAAEQKCVVEQAQAAQEQAIAADARRREEQDKQLLAIYIREQYSNQNDFLTYVLAGSSLADVLERTASISHVQASTQDLVEAIAQDVDKADRAAAKAQASANAAAAETARLKTLHDELAQEITGAQSLIGQLGGQLRAAADELSVVNTQDLALAQQIANLRIQQLDQTIAAAESADWQAAETYIQNHLGDFPGFDGTLTAPPSGSTLLSWPAPHTTISQGFGPTGLTFEPPFDGYPHFHTGIDLAGSLGQPIYAAAPGIVVAAMNGTVGYGNYVIIAHANGMLTLYGHLEGFLVKAGQTVKQGDLIGLLGSTGNSTGPHCHFEVRINNVPTDPMLYLPPLPPGATGP